MNTFVLDPLTWCRRGGCGGARSGAYSDRCDFPSFRGFGGRPPRHFRYLIIFHLFDCGGRRRARRWPRRWCDGRRRCLRCCRSRMMVLSTRVVILLRLHYNQNNPLKTMWEWNRIRMRSDSMAHWWLTILLESFFLLSNKDKSSLWIRLQSKSYIEK